MHHRQGNTMDRWPVHHRAHTHTHTHFGLLWGKAEHPNITHTDPGRTLSPFLYFLSHFLSLILHSDYRELTFNILGMIRNAITRR